tara:strand:+ start:5119 stop:7944 length:2826 start_codon:yes stop_codon:yes gene_type:complete
MVKEFYIKALPSQGVYCVADIDSTTKKTNHKFVESIEDLAKVIEDKNKQNTNVFVAMSSFSGYSRKADKASYVRSFFVDLDVGEGKGYDSKEDAIKSLDKFVFTHDLPIPVTVDSGTGVHAYWFLDRDVPADEWKLYAEKFKDFCLDNGLLIDPVVSADLARILRSPDTFNHKTNPPTPTKVITWSDSVCSFQGWVNILGEAEVSLESIMDTKTPLTEEQRKALKLDNFQSVFKTIVVKSLKGEGCAQIKHIIINAKTLEEPMWYAGLSIAQHCKDRNEAIHMMSEDHPQYNKQDTERKANQTQDKPYACTSFNTVNPGGCDGCQHKGKITNPLALGKEFVPAISNTNTPLIVNGRMVGLPKDLSPFVYGGNEGGIYYQPPQEHDEDGQPLPRKKPVMVCQYDLYPIKRIYSTIDGECLLMKYHPPHDPHREFMLPMRNLFAVDRFRDTITREGILYNPNNQQGKYLMTYIYAWGEYLISKNKAEIMRMQMGWTEDKKAFVVGEKEINNRGEILHSPTSPLCKGIAKHLSSEGEYDLWKLSANKLNNPSLELHAFTMLTGFGSVVMNNTSTNGITVSLTSSDSGSGKTGALNAALSIWGNPIDLSVIGSGGATANAMTGRYLGLHNIPFGLDEVGNIEGKALSNLVHKISNGKAKIRMQASVNAEREHEMSASLIAIFTSNHSLYNKIESYKNNSSGEVARLVEFTVRKPKIFVDDPTTGMDIFNPFNTNYGWAGIDFIQTLFKLPASHVESRIIEWSKRFKSDFGDDTTYRFYENLIASTFTAGEIAVEAGIIDLDLDRIYQKVVGEVINIKDNVARVNDIDYESILGEYINAHQTGILAVEDNKVTMEPRSDLVIRAELDESKVFIEKKHFRDYLTNQGVSINEFIFRMKEKGYKIQDRKKRMGTGWKPATGFSSITTVEINTTKFLDDIFKEQSNEAS